MFPFDYSKGRPGKVKIYFNDILEPNQSAELLKAEAHRNIKNILKRSI